MKIFGTDGIRGVANADLSAELALACGRAIALACRDGALGGAAAARPQIVLGRDTRVSGDLLSAALVAGITSAGADVLHSGILPTPGVAFLTCELGADAGVVVSASHNPGEDNGVKVFGQGGWKLGNAAEDALEALLDGPATSLPTGASVGRASGIERAEDRYVDHLAATVTSNVSSLRVVVDCAYGAAFRVAPRALRAAGASVATVHDEPDGSRINAGCGATHPEVVAALAARDGIIGLTHDGDADRVLASDEEGMVVDGDAIIAMLARRLRDTNGLAGDAIAVTVMSNEALRSWCASERIGIVETAVGDRHVLEAMRDRGLVLGGEQSGHVIRLDHATTGDGVLTALGVLEAVAACGGRLADAVPFRPLPQVLVNVKVADARRVAAGGAVRAVVESSAAELAGRGRVLVRASGTEPLVRVMVEAPTVDEARLHANRIAAVVDAGVSGRGTRTA